MTNIIKIGHRGAAGYEPENTLKSFKRAIELGADMIELDVYLCKSGELVIIHDDKVNRTTDGSGYITEKTFQEIQKLNAGQGEKIPTLNQVLDLVNRKVILNIELKGPDTAKPTAEIVENYIKQKNWPSQNFLVSSFDHRELVEFKKIMPQINIGVLYTGIPDDLTVTAQKLKAHSIHLSYEFISQELVDDAHKRGLKVFAFTVNDSNDIKKMLSLGVDGIFSDFPDRL